MNLSPQHLITAFVGASWGSPQAWSVPRRGGDDDVATQANHRRQLGGITLTTTILYLSLTIHNQTRLRQSTLLQQQTHVIDVITNPQSQLIPRTTREVRAGLVEAAKDKWNAQVEQEMRTLQNIDWNDVWDRVEDGISTVYRRALSRGIEAVPDASKKSS